MKKKGIIILLFLFLSGITFYSCATYEENIVLENFENLEQEYVVVEFNKNDVELYGKEHGVDTISLHEFVLGIIRLTYHNADDVYIHSIHLSGNFKNSKYVLKVLPILKN